MSVKVTTTPKQEVSAKPFPKLMINITNGRIVFFLEDKKGVQLNEIDNVFSFNKPNYSDDWGMKNYTDYNEPITIQND